MYVQQNLLEIESSRSGSEGTFSKFPVLKNSVFSPQYVTIVSFRFERSGENEIRLGKVLSMRSSFTSTIAMDAGSASQFERLIPGHTLNIRSLGSAVRLFIPASLLRTNERRRVIDA